MIIKDLKKYNIPDSPGVYFFLGSGRQILYIGKATSLRDRVRSYFNHDIVRTRGPWIEQMMEKARGIKFEKTDSVLEAMILEARLIKKYKPAYNTKEKDDKSFNYVIVTDEEYPRVMLVRERQLTLKNFPESQAVFGPFAQSTMLREAMRVVRKIFPFRDKCEPMRQESLPAGRPCFNRQIGLCPGVCDGGITRAEYKKTISHIKKLFNGRKTFLIKDLKREMKTLAGRQEFEKAGEVKKTIFALEHIYDVSLIKDDFHGSVLLTEAGRIEAVDISHFGGKYAVGVVVAVAGGKPDKSAYRKFRIKTAKDADDIAALSEVLRRRLAHKEWGMPTLLVVDGGLQQKNAAEKVLRVRGLSIPVVAVVKGEHHKPKTIMGRGDLIERQGKEILLANSESHRFAIKYNRKLRSNWAA
ncbi:MAG: GIY-YIG nuclease family protein [Patescibacteria group bacterium]